MPQLSSCETISHSNKLCYISIYFLIRIGRYFQNLYIFHESGILKDIYFCRVKVYFSPNRSKKNLATFQTSRSENPQQKFVCLLLLFVLRSLSAIDCLCA